MSLPDTGWRSKDAWVLTALPRWKRTDLPGLIADFDALNHEVVPREELEASLRRLGGAGLVELGDKIGLTTEGRKLVRQGKGRGMIQMAMSVERLLAAVPPPAEPAAWTIEPTAYELAVKDYLGASA